MSKKLMLLAAGALSALAFAALPAFASAEELEAHCPVAPCIGTITGSSSEHSIELENDAGEKVDATALDGTIEIKTGTTKTATVELDFTHVYETSSGFKFTCNTPGQASGTIKTGPLTAHFINIGKSTETIPGVLLTLPAAGITFECAGGLVKKTVTGNIIGTILEPTTVCNKADTNTKVTFNIKGVGTQEHELYTGTAYDLISGPHATDTTTSAQTGHANIDWQVGNHPTLTCP
jgi:hypothetical protein